MEPLGGFLRRSRGGAPGGRGGQTGAAPARLRGPHAVLHAGGEHLGPGLLEVLQRRTVVATARIQETQVQMLDDLAQRAFHGSAMRLVMRMVSSGRLSAEELAEIQRLARESEGAEE